MAETRNSSPAPDVTARVGSGEKYVTPQGFVAIRDGVKSSALCCDQGTQIRRVRSNDVRQFERRTLLAGILTRLARHSSVGGVLVLPGDGGNRSRGLVVEARNRTS